MAVIGIHANSCTWIPTLIYSHQCNCSLSLSLHKLQKSVYSFILYRSAELKLGWLSCVIRGFHCCCCRYEPPAKQETEAKACFRQWRCQCIGWISNGRKNKTFSGPSEFHPDPRRMLFFHFSDLVTSCNKTIFMMWHIYCVTFV